MIHHIVMFKITKFEDEQDKGRKIEELKSTFEKLKGKIKNIKTFEVGLNLNTSSCAYDVIVNSSFKTLDDLNNYIMHPDHQYTIEKVSTIPKSKVVVDYEISRSKR